MFGFIKKAFVVSVSFFSEITLSATPLKCISMNNQEFKVRPELLMLIVMNLYFFPFNIKASKCSGSCNNISNP